jgi:trimeric autotransporter adhesin
VAALLASMARFSRILLFLACSSPGWCQVITSIAGTDWLFPGDGSKAINAPIGGSVGLDVATGPDGSFYIADPDNQMIMRVGTDGILHVIAGNGYAGHWGDGGLAVNAALFNSDNVAVDAAGNVYIAEYGGHDFGGSIRIVTPDGNINTIAGTGALGSTGDGGPAKMASLDRPVGVAVDSGGNVYFTEQASSRIRKFRPGGSISTIAGGGQISGSKADGGKATDAALGGLTRLAVDSGGNVYFIDSLITVRKVTPGGILSTVAGGGLSTADGVPATQAQMLPAGIAVDLAGNLYIADFDFSAIRKVTNGIISTIAGGGLGFQGDGGPASIAFFNFPAGAMAVAANGDVFVADNENLRIRKVSGGLVQTVAGNGLFRLAGNGGPAASATIYYASGLRTDPAGNIYFAENTLNRLRKIGTDGTISIFAGDGIFGYAGDNGPAANARLAFPTFLATDAAGDVFFSDSVNDVIRKIDANQIITTIAGTGFVGYSGDTGPAQQASLHDPSGLDLDGEGDLWFADSFNHAIRVIRTDGVIFTIAGTGTAGYSGDGGSSVAAQLNGPQGVRIFAPGTPQEAVYFSDTGNNRVRRIRFINSQFVIDTVAGNGNAGYSGDGGPATNASLNQPEGLAFDSAGVLYIADTGNTVVRAVNSKGVISTVVGNGSYNFSGDGGPPQQASLEAPFDLTFDAGGNLLITDFFTNRIREVLTTRPAVQANPVSLAFTAPAGSRGVQQTISVTGSIPNFAFGAAVASGSSWLSVTPVSANAPSDIQVTADPSRLAPGPYNGTLQIQAPNENPPVIAIPVAFTVTEPGAPSVAVTPTAFRFQFVTGTPAASQTLSISNAGGGSLSLSVTTSTSIGAWLSSSATSVSVGAYGATRVQIQANPAGLGPGAYSGTITIASVNPPQKVLVPVTMVVTAVSQTILIPQDGLTFFAVQGGGLPPPQTFNILNAGKGQMSWNTSVSTSSGGNWLAAFPNNGVTDASSPSAPPQIRVNVFPGTLTAGVYYGYVKVTSAGANNSPQYVSVVLNLLSPGSHVGPLVQPTGMIFVAASGGESPGSQPVLVQSLNTSSLTFTSGLSTSAGGNWLTVLPPGGTVTAGQPATIVVQPRVGGLAPGVYQGTLTLSFSDGSIRTVTVVFVVTASASAVPASHTIADATGPACPSVLKVVFTELSTGSSVSVGFPGQVTVKVVDDCGAPLVNGSVTASFSNGDQPLSLTSLNDGTWAATWTPQFATSQAVVTAAAADTNRRLTGTAQVKVGFQQFAQPPVVGTGAVVNAASFARQAPLAPGTLVSVFGLKLAASQAVATKLPLPVDLGGSSLFIAGVQAPLLFSSDGQVNALIPYGIQVNAGQQFVISRGNSLSVAQGLTMSAAAPGVFSTDGSGKGQGHIYVAHADFTQTLADAGHPAKAGDFIVIYCTGLGEVTPPVTAGAPAPFDHLTHTENPVTVTIGGVAAQVQFAGLTPGFAGLYQVNVVVPKGVTPGAALVLSIIGSGQVSSPVTMAVQ